MKFKHHATGRIIEVKPIESISHEIVYCKELNKKFKVFRKKGFITQLEKTSYVLLEDKNE